MRTSLKSFSLPIALVQIAGWLTVGLMFWLLLLTHDAVAAPASGSWLGTSGHQAVIAHQREQRHAAFWQAREANRTSRADRGVLGRLLHRSAHQRAEHARTTHRQPVRAYYNHIKPGGASSLGPALGAIFSRN